MTASRGIGRGGAQGRSAARPTLRYLVRPFGPTARPGKPRGGGWLLVWAGVGDPPAWVTYTPLVGLWIADFAFLREREAVRRAEYMSAHYTPGPSGLTRYAAQRLTDNRYLRLSPPTAWGEDAAADWVDWPADGSTWGNAYTAVGMGQSHSSESREVIAVPVPTDQTPHGGN